jgi:methyl-accepting chemotaxis protein
LASKSRTTIGGIELARQDLHLRLAGQVVAERVGLLQLRRHSEDLAGLNEAFAAVVRGIADPMFIAAPDLTILHMNEACARAVGYSVEEVVGKMKCSQVMRSDICESSCALKACMRDRHSITGARVTIQDRAGRRIPVLASASPLMDADGNVIGGMEIVRDITEQVALQEQAEAAELRATNVMEGADPLFIADKDLIVTYMNDACARATGYSKEEVVGKMRCRDVFRASICQTSCALQHCMRTRETISGARVTITNRAGQTIPVSVSAAPIYDKQGNVVGGFEICRDITKETETELQVRSASDQLSTASSEVAAGIQDSTTVAEHVATAVQSIAGDMEAMVTSSSRGAELAREGLDAVQRAMGTMESVGGASSALLDGMRALSSRAQEIGEITRVIEEVAEQTNLLALNAAIEAARAGEHGRGFAVVADEVRKLAERASTATKDITTLVRGIQQLVEARTLDAEGAAHALEEGVRNVSEMARSFEEVTEAIREMDGRAQSVSAATEEVSASSEEMSATFEEMAASTEELAALASGLRDTAEQLGS